MSHSIRNKYFALAAMAIFMAPTDGEANQNGGTASTNIPATDAVTAEQNNQAATNAANAEAAKEVLHSTIKANFDNKVDVKETSFHFRKVKDEKSGMETKRPTVTIPLPYPSVEGIIAIIENGGKGLELLLEAAGGVVVDQAREYVNSNEAVTAENFPYATLGWEFIANLPKAERRGGGISKEVWEDFGKDYMAIMPAAANKTAEQVELAAKVFLSKFSTAKTNKPVLKVLQSQLAIYANTTARGEEFAQCIEFLDNKLTTLLATDDSKLLENL